jgi:diadenosine tetraphosphate (Ap4A) HIT family hydrolase
MSSYDQNNIFAKIIKGEIPSTKIYEDDKILAFEDISKAAPVHILVIPKGQYVSFSDFCLKAGAAEVDNFFKKIAKIASDQNLDESGYRLITNNGANAGQTVFHFHFHILGKKKMNKLLP